MHQYRQVHQVKRWQIYNFSVKSFFFDFCENFVHDSPLCGGVIVGGGVLYVGGVVLSVWVILGNRVILGGEVIVAVAPWRSRLETPGRAGWFWRQLANVLSKRICGESTLSVSWTSCFNKSKVSLVPTKATPEGSAKNECYPTKSRKHSLSSIRMMRKNVHMANFFSNF